MKWLMAAVLFTLVADSTVVDTIITDTMNYEQQRAVNVRKANIVQQELNDIDAKLDSVLKYLERR